MVFLLARTLVYGTLFIGFVLVYLPARVLSWSGVVRPPTGVWQVVGMLSGAAGALLALWCVATFVVAGRGTPAPFDPPRQLVTAGPYGVIRNPMYVGAGLALAGAALFYLSPWLLAYTVTFILVAHGFVIGYEEPVLRRTFGADYRTYCEQVPRWLPNIGRRNG